MEVLGQVLQDAADLARQTTLLATPVLELPSEGQSPDGDLPGQPQQPTQAARPAWVMRDYIGDQQTAINDRTKELLDAFQQINASKQKQEEQDKQKDSSAAAADQQQQQQDAQTQQLLKNVAAATPHVEQAITHFQQATAQLEKTRCTKYCNNRPQGSRS